MVLSAASNPEGKHLHGKYHSTELIEFFLKVTELFYGLNNRFIRLRSVVSYQSLTGCANLLLSLFPFTVIPRHPSLIT
jgi:hypothetical protein